MLEVYLNVAWAALALALVCLWLRTGPASGRDRMGQLVAIAVLIAILFPVISVSDDLLAIQNAAETDTFLRRHPLAPATVHPMAMAITRPPPFYLGAPLAFAGVLPPAAAEVRAFAHPERASIQNRPPPAA